MNTGNPYLHEIVVEKTDTVKIVKVTTLGAQRKNGKIVRINGKVIKIATGFSYKIVAINGDGEEQVVATLGEARKQAGIDYKPASKETRPAADYKEQQKGFKR